MTKLEKLTKSDRKIFTIDDLVIIWQSKNRREAVESAKDYVNRKRLLSIRRGVYALDESYNEFELSQKLVTPSYISYVTALGYYGIIFQHYTEIHAMANYSKSIVVWKNKFTYHKLTESILNNRLGIENRDGYNIASKERAVCDSIYINPRLGFDNLRGLDLVKLELISKIYNKKSVEKSISKIIKIIKDQNA